MKKKTTLLPKQQKILQELGENIKLARLRRRISAEQISERAGIARKTFWSIENGHATVSIGAYLQVLFVLGLDKDLLFVAKDDKLGRKLQDAELTVGKRAPKKTASKITIETVILSMKLFFKSLFWRKHLNFPLNQ